MDYVNTLAAQWKELSNKLRLKVPALNRFRVDYPRDCMMCLSLAMEDWLKQNYDSKKHGRPSWRRLARAAKELDYGVFEKIAREHQGKRNS